MTSLTCVISQRVDEIHRGRYVRAQKTSMMTLTVHSFSYPGILRLHHGLPTAVRDRRSRHRILDRVQRDCSSSVVGRCLLLCSSLGADHLPHARLRLEIVRSIRIACLVMVTDVHPAIGEHISRRRTTSRRKFRSTTSRITDLAKNSMSLPPRLYCLLLLMFSHHCQVPEGDQEGPRCATHAAESRVRLQPDGKRVATGPGAAYTSLRHIEDGCAADWVLRGCQFTVDIYLLLYHYTDMYFTVFLACDANLSQSSGIMEEALGIPDASSGPRTSSFECKPARLRVAIYLEGMCTFHHGPWATVIGTLCQLSCNLSTTATT